MSRLGPGAVDLCRAEQEMILTHAVIVVCELEAQEAEAVVGPHSVFAGTVTTRLSVALIDVYNAHRENNRLESQHTSCELIHFQSERLTQAHGLVRSGLEAVVAETAIASLHIDTLSMATHVWNLLALVTV